MTNSVVSINGSALGTALGDLLMADDMAPGTDLTYQLAKTIYVYHPLGKKMAESPIMMAQSQPRKISVPKSPEERVREAFQDEWARCQIDRTIFNTMRLSRIYGLASVVVLIEGEEPAKPLNFDELVDKEISFNVFDPLNTAGSLVLNQQPNALDFQKHEGISVNGMNYHRSRVVVVMNEDPIYISYTSSAFGFVGRSVYERALYPLKSFVQTMITDDMVTRKAGVLVAKIKAPGSIIDNLTQTFMGNKRDLVKEAQTNNVLSITPDEDIESLNLQNVDAAFTAARKNILENIAVAADMPAKLLNSETFAEGFADGSEDAKDVARYIASVREAMKPLYDFFDKVIQYRAWNEEFYKTIQADFPEYKDVPYKQAFYDWRNSFTATWPNLLEEPDSEKIKVEATKYNAILGLLTVLLPNLDPENKALLIDWAQDNFNENKLLFNNPLQLDSESLKDYTPPQAGGEGEEPVKQPAAKKV